MVNIYFVRHGESENNLIKKMNHNPKNKFNLTKKGIEQAENAGKELSNIKFDKVFSSQFLRTIESAKIISCGHMWDNVGQCGTNFKIDSRLNEMKIGVEGDDYSFHRDRVNSQIIYNKVLDDDENINKRIEDLKLFLDDLKKINLKNILVVTHKDIIRLIKIIVENLDIENFEKIQNSQKSTLKNPLDTQISQVKFENHSFSKSSIKNFYDFNPKNCEVYKIKL